MERRAGGLGGVHGGAQGSQGGTRNPRETPLRGWGFKTEEGLTRLSEKKWWEYGGSRVGVGMRAVRRAPCAPKGASSKRRGALHNARLEVELCVRRPTRPRTWQVLREQERRGGALIFTFYNLTAESCRASTVPRAHCVKAASASHPCELHRSCTIVR